MAEKKNIPTQFIQKMFSGRLLMSDFVRQQQRYLFFLFVLGILYIAIHYRIERTVRESRRLERQVENLHAEYVTKSAELMRLSKRSELLRQIRQRNLNLQEPLHPPKKIQKD